MQSRESRLLLSQPTHAVPVCVVDTVRALAREGSSDRMDGEKRKRCDALKGASTSLRVKLIFNSLGRK